MEFRNILLEKEEHVARIIFNRPDRLNAMNEEVTAEIAAALREVRRDDSVRVLILTGAGRAFCAGADLSPDVGEKALYETNAQAVQENIREQARGVIQGLQSLPQPTIAMVNGACVGMGFDIALACDLRIGSEQAKFMVAYTRVGIIAGQGGAWLLARVVGLPKAAELLFTGDFLEAGEAERVGVLNRLVPAADLEKETLAMARRIAGMPPLAVRWNKIHLYKMLEMNLDTALDFAAATQPILLSSQDYKEAVAAFLEKRPGVFRGR